MIKPRHQVYLETLLEDLALDVDQSPADYVTGELVQVLRYCSIVLYYTILYCTVLNSVGPWRQELHLFIKNILISYIIFEGGYISPIVRNYIFLYIMNYNKNILLVTKHRHQIL